MRERERSVDLVDLESCEWPGKNKSDANAFIFSLTNEDNFQFKMKIDPNQQQHAFVCDFWIYVCGPIFGEDHDFYIAIQQCSFMGFSF